MIQENVMIQENKYTLESVLMLYSESCTVYLLFDKGTGPI